MRKLDSRQRWRDTTGRRRSAQRRPALLSSGSLPAPALGQSGPRARACSSERTTPLPGAEPSHGLRRQAHPAANARRRRGRGGRLLLVRLRPLAEPALLRRLAQELALPAAARGHPGRSQGGLVCVQAHGDAAVLRRLAREAPAGRARADRAAEVDPTEVTVVVSQRRTSKAVRPSPVRSMTSTLFTCAAGGPRSSQTSIASTDFSFPSSQTSTRPSGRFFTQPARPSSSAHLRTYQRKPTPCTRPETRTWRQTRDMERYSPWTAPSTPALTR